MDNLQAKQMLKQVDCHGIPRGYNGGYSELYAYCLKSIEKLERIEQIIERTEGTLGLDNYTVQQIKEVLNG
jgi:hypothetical protein